jgi:putative methionine-R-sulfoxide reductase with GAF domain
MKKAQVTLVVHLRVSVVLDINLCRERNFEQYPKILAALRMDHYSIFDPGLSPEGSAMPPSAHMALTDDVCIPELPPVDALELRSDPWQSAELAPSNPHAAWQQRGGSLAEMAESDLDAILQLLAERAEYITRATGAAIALREGEEMVCRASAGSSAPALGAHLQVDSGLTGESVRTRQILRCDDAETDPRVNRESCQALGIASVVVMPLAHEQEITGLFELFSDEVAAFTERDLEALQRLGEMVHTALLHTSAARTNPGVLQVEAEPIAEKAAAEVPVTEPTIKKSPVIEPPAIPSKPSAPPFFHLKNTTSKAVSHTTKAPSTESKPTLEMKDEPAPAGKGQPEQIPGNPSSEQAVTKALVAELGSIAKCETCGFPVSKDRRLCLDCERRREAEARNSGQKGVPAHQFSSQFVNGEVTPPLRDKLWMFHDGYVMGALVVFLVVLIAMVLSHSS